MREQKPSSGKNDNFTTASNDAVIGRAFRWSLLILLLILLGLGAVVYLKHYRLDQAPAVDSSPIQPPRQAEPEATSVLPVLPFSEITAQSGIDFMHVNGAEGERLLPETLGSGAAFFDYDNDNDQDLLLINSRPWSDTQQQPTMALYANDGRGGFSDVTATSGLAVTCYGMGVAVGDYDNDGYRDLFVTALGANRLFRNLGGRFEEVTRQAGVAGAEHAWSTSATFIDYDNDGDLDLFVANYVRWSREVDFEVDFRLTGIGRAYGPPTAFEGSDAYLYRNDGAGRFSDVSRAAGVQIANPATGRPMAKALAVAPVDLDGDGWLDLLVANDTVRNFYFHNLGDGRFEEIGTEVGIAFDRNGAATGAMGVDVAHFRNDKALGLAVGNFANEMSSLYVTQGDPGLLADESIVEGLGPASRQALTFGVLFLDLDLDGRLDLLQANGHLEQEINKVQPSQHYAQPAQLFWNCGAECRQTFVPLPKHAVGDLARPLVGRGAAYGDIDNDGDLDLVITQNGRRPALLRNDQRLGNHWLRVRLQAQGGNRDALGAWVELSANGIVQRRQVMPSRSYLSQVELPVTFGLGQAEQLDYLRVHWPDGSVETFHDLAIDAESLIRQGSVASAEHSTGVK